MLIETKGIVIKDNNVGEQDRLITLLTEKLGVIRAFARGARSIKNKSVSATEPFSYSRMSIYCSADKFIIRDIEPLEVFFGLREDLDRLALAQYFAELSMELAPREENAKDYLRLILNCLHFLCNGEKPLRQIKSIFELRILSMAGYMPMLEACASCGKAESKEMYFDTQTGELFCSACSHSVNALSMSVVSAMRYIIYSDFNKLFSFVLSDIALRDLNTVSEQYLLAQTERNFKTLDFYKSIHMGE